jgi:hypothetical protein
MRVEGPKVRVSGEGRTMAEIRLCDLEPRDNATATAVRDPLFSVMFTFSQANGKTARRRYTSQFQQTAFFTGGYPSIECELSPVSLPG